MIYTHYLIQSLRQPSEAGATLTHTRRWWPTVHISRTSPYPARRLLLWLRATASHGSLSGSHTQGQLEMLDRNAPRRSPQATANGALVENYPSTFTPHMGQFWGACSTLAPVASNSSCPQWSLARSLNHSLYSHPSLPYLPPPLP